MAVTLEELITRVRQRTDTVDSDFVTDEELTQLINTAYKELYGMLVTKSLHRSEAVFELEADGSLSYDLPIDFFALMGVYRVLGGSCDPQPLERFPDKYRSGSRSGDAVMYRVSGSKVVLYPVPSSGTYEVVYIPIPGDLIDPTDLLDGVLGWEEFVVLEAAICVLEKEESDTSKLEYKRDRILKRIRDEAEAVEFTETPRILNTRDKDRPDWVDPNGDWNL